MPRPVRTCAPPFAGAFLTCVCRASVARCANLIRRFQPHYEAHMSQQEHNLQMDYIEFPATDIEATKRFYGQVFGWQFTDYGPGYTSFHDGRLAGGFNGESQPAAGDGAKTRGVLVVIYAGSQRHLRQGESSWWQDRPRAL